MGSNPTVETDVNKGEVAACAGAFTVTESEGCNPRRVEVSDGTKAVPCYRNDGKDWQPVDAAGIAVSTDKTSLSVLTYNVWFGEHNFDDRVRAIIQIILDSDADIVCLQEVTGNFLKMFLRNDTILSRYYLSGNGIRGYGVCMLIKFPCHFSEC